MKNNMKILNLNKKLKKNINLRLNKKCTTHIK